MKHDPTRKQSHEIATKSDQARHETPPSDEDQTPQQPHPQQQRQRHLARNRAAASKSRQRKRRWIEGLEKDLQQKEARNTVLRDTVDSLRRERAMIKTMCLQHVDCDCVRIRHYMSAALEEQLARFQAQSGYPGMRSGSLSDTLSSPIVGSAERSTPSTILDESSSTPGEDRVSIVTDNSTPDLNPYSTMMWEKRIADGAIDIDSELNYFLSEAMGY